MHNGVLLKNNGRIRITALKHLVISQSIDTDAGVYQCLAENVLGSIQATAQARRNVSNNQPNPPENLHGEALSSTQIRVTWDRAKAENGYEIIAYSLHFTPTNGKIIHLGNIVLIVIIVNVLAIMLQVGDGIRCHALGFFAENCVPATLQLPILSILPFSVFATASTLARGIYTVCIKPKSFLDLNL